MATVPAGNRPILIIGSLAFVALLQTLGLGSSPLVLGLAIGLLGIPHGAVDHHMMRSGGGRTADILRYLAAIVLVVSVWWLAPSVMLVLFLLNSAWHFGDCDVPNVGRLHWARALLYGTSILVLLVDPRDPSVRAIIEELLRGPLDISLLADLDVYRISASALVLILPASVSVPVIRVRLVRSIAIIAVAYSADSLLAFTWYFAIVHSLSSMDALRYHLGGRFPWPWKKLLVAALPLSIVSYLGIGLASVFLAQSSGLVALFVALSALTVPHSVLFHRVYKKRY